MPRRLLIVLGAAVVGGIFAAGLFIPGRLGGALLAVTAAVLIGLTSLTWAHINPRGRPIRLVIIAAVVVGAAIKLIKG